MDATPEVRRKEMLDQILAMATKMASELEECKAVFRSTSPAFVPDSSPRSTPSPHSASPRSAQYPLANIAADNWGGLFEEPSLVMEEQVYEPPTSDSALPPPRKEMLVVDTPAADAPVCVTPAPSASDSELSGTAGKVTTKREEAQIEARSVPVMVSFEQDAVRILELEHGVDDLSAPRPPWLRRPRRAPPRPPRLPRSGRAPLRRRGRSPRLLIRGRRPRFGGCALLPQPGAVHPGRLTLMSAPMPALEFKFLIRPYDPGAGFVFDACDGVYFDTEEADHAYMKTFAMGLLRCSTCTPADIRTAMGTTLDDVYVVFDPGAPSHPPGEDLAVRPHARGFRDPSGRYLGLANTTTSNLFGVKELPIASHTRCSMLCFYQAFGNELHVTKLGLFYIDVGTELLCAMPTRCSMQGHGSDEVTTLSLCALFMTAVAIYSTLHHEENAPELLRIQLPLEPMKLLSFVTLRMSVFGVFKDWREQPWPPPKLVEILGCQVEDSIMKIRPTPCPSFSYQVEVESKERLTAVCYVSFDVGSWCSKENMAWYYYLQFVLEPFLLKGQMLPDGDFDLHRLLHGSVLQVVLTPPLSIVCHGVVPWDRIKVLWCEGTEKPYMYNSCSVLFDPGITFLHTSNILITILLLTALLYSWTPLNYKMLLLLLCVNCLPSLLGMEMYCHWKFSESEHLWGTYELPIPMGMSYSTSEITGLNPHEVVNVNNNSSSLFGLSKLALLVLFGKHIETSSSCQVSVEHILQWPPLNQNKFRSMFVELAKLLELLMDMAMKAIVELFADSVSMKGLLSSSWNIQRTLQLYGTVCSEDREGDFRLSKYHDQAFLMDFVSTTVALKEDRPNWRSSNTKCLRLSAAVQQMLQIYDGMQWSAFVQITLRIKYIQVLWDPGGLFSYGLGASRILRRGVCHIPTILLLSGLYDEVGRANIGFEKDVGCCGCAGLGPRRKSHGMQRDTNTEASRAAELSMDQEPNRPAAA